MKYIVLHGSEDGFHVTVERAAFNDDGFSIVLWNRNSGMGGFPVIRDQAKAERIAKFLYDELLPEHEAQHQRQMESIARYMEEDAKRPKPKPPRVPKNAPILDVLECPECQALMPPDDVGEERVYECGECGQKGVGDDGRRCDQCNKFCAKISDTSCPECDGPMDEAETVKAKRATNKELIKQ